MSISTSISISGSSEVFIIEVYGITQADLNGLLDRLDEPIRISFLPDRMGIYPISRISIDLLIYQAGISDL